MVYLPTRVSFSILHLLPCSNDSDSETEDYSVNFNCAGYSVNISGPSSSCANVPYNLTANGANTYVWTWNDDYGQSSQFRTAAGASITSAIWLPHYSMTNVTKVYNVAGKLTNGCTIQKSFTVAMQTGCKMGEDETINSITANVSGGILELGNKGNTSMSLHLISTDGKVIKQAESNSDFSINVQDVPNGVYILDINSNGVTTKQKIVINQ
jgi:hypothetical protein